MPASDLGPRTLLWPLQPTVIPGLSGRLEVIDACATPAGRRPGHRNGGAAGSDGGPTQGDGIDRIGRRPLIRTGWRLLLTVATYRDLANESTIPRSAPP